MESRPYFSICVPTRNRSETLLYCLKTLLDQDFDSYEIIVSDNSDIEENRTKEVINQLNSSKIKYFRQHTVLSMTENYEFALSKAYGKFITCLGDDDGLIVNSLSYVKRFIEHYDATVVKCAEPVYWWPGSHVHPQSAMTFPYERPVSKILSKSSLGKVANFELSYFNLPMLYYSFISRDIIDEVIAEKGSFFQNCSSIDMYSGFVIAYKTESYFITDKPFVIPGLSSKSNGSSTTVSYENKIAKEFLFQNKLQGDFQKYHIPFLPKFNLALFVWSELSKFIENYNLKESLHIEYKNIFVEMISSDSTINNLNNIGDLENFNEYPLYKQDIDFFKSNFLEKTLYYLRSGNNNTLIYQSFAVDPLLFSVKDIYGASLLCKNLMEARKNNLPLEVELKPASMKPTRTIFQRISSRLSRTAKMLITGK